MAQARRNQMDEEYRRKGLHTLEDGSTRYKFKGFADRISEVNIDVFHKVGANANAQVSLEAEDNRTYFAENALRWRDINLSIGYKEYLGEVSQYIVTLPKLIYHRDTIVEITLKHLKKLDPLSLKPILDLLSTLARDLRAHAFPNFTEILVFLVEDVLDPHNAASVEDVFTAICFMFKYLQKQLVRDFDNLFVAYQSMFGHSKLYIRQFAAESLSFLFRKIELEKLPETIATIFASTSKNKTEEYNNGLAYLFFHSLKGTQGQFHSRASQEIPLLLQALDYNKDSELSLEQQITEHAKQFDVISNMMRIILTHTKKSEAANKLLWGLLDAETKRLSLDWHDSHNIDIRAHVGEQLGQVMLIVRDWAAKARKYIPDLELVCVILRRIIDPVVLLDSSTSDLAVQRAFGAFLAIQATLSVSRLPSFISFFEVLSKFKRNPTYMLDAFRSIDVVVLSGPLSTLFIKYIEEIKDITSVMDLVIGVSQSSDAPLSLPTPRLTDGIFALLKDYCSGKTSDYPKLALALETLSCVQVDKNKAAKQLTDVLDKNATDMSGVTTSDKILLGKTMLSIARLLGDASQAPSTLADKAISIVRSCYDSVHVLDGAAAILRISPITNFVSQQNPANEPPSKKKKTATPQKPQGPVKANVKGNEIPEGKQPNTVLLDLVPLIAPNLSKRSSSIRKATLGFMKNFASPPNSTATMDILFETLLEIENTSISAGLEAPRMVMKMDNVENWLDTAKISKLYHPILANFFIGAYYIKFSELWKSVEKALTTLLTLDFHSVWPVLLAKLTEEAPAIEEEAEEEKVEEEPAVVEKGKKKRKRVSTVIERAPKPTIFKPKDREWTTVDADKLFDDSLQRESGENDACTDATLYGKSLWTFLGGVVPTVESHSKDIITIFLDYIRQTMPTLLQKLDAMVEQEEEQEEGGRNLAYGANLSTFLSIISKFRRPNKMFQAETVYTILDRLLPNPNATVQKLALQCIINWHGKLLPYKTHLENLIPENKFRDALAVFGYAGDDAIIKKDHRKEVVDVMVKLLWPKMSSIKEPTKGALIVEWFSGLELDEIQPLIDFIFAPFSHITALAPEALCGKGGIVTPKVSYQLTFLVVSEHLLERLPVSILEHHLSNILKTTLYLVGKNIMDSRDTKVRRNLSFERLAHFVGNNPDFDYSSYFALFQDIKCMRYVTKAIAKGVLNLFRVFAVVPFLTPLLNEPGLMPQLIGLLKSQDQTQKEIIGMLEDILEVSESNPAAKSLIIPNITLILQSLPYSGSGRMKLHTDKSGKFLRKKDVLGYFKLVANLSEYTTDPKNASLLLDVISPILYRSTKSENILLAMLTVAANQIPFLDNVLEHYQHYMRLFSFTAIPAGRQALVGVLDAFAKRMPELVVVSQVVKDFHTAKENEKRIQALQEVNSKHMQTWTATQLCPILHILAFIVRTPSAKETAFVTATIDGLKKFIARVGTMDTKKKEGEDFIELLEDAVLHTAFTCVRGKDVRIRKDFLSVIGYVVQQVPHLLSDLQCLITEKVNFFDDYHSSSFSRKRDAYRLFSQFVEKITLEHIQELFLPLFEKTMLTVNFGDQIEADNLIKCIGSCTKVFPWTLYVNYISKLMGKINTNKSKSSELVSAVCAVVDNFHFAEVLPVSTAPVMAIKRKKREVYTIDDSLQGEATTEEFSDSRYEGLLEEDQDETMEDKVLKEYNEGKQKKPKAEEKEEAKEEEEEDEEEAGESALSLLEKAKGTIQEGPSTDGKPSTEELNKEIIEHLLPMLLQHVSVKKGTGASVRVFVANAVVKLLRFLPKEEFDANLPGLIAKLCYVVSSKDEVERIAARKTIVNIGIDLGPNYLLYLLTELDLILSNGFQRHVLCVITHALLAELCKTISTGQIDYCFPILSKLILDEVFGKIAGEKDKKMFKVHAEARTSYAYQTLNLYICTKIEFKQSIGHVIQLLHKAITSTKRDDMERILAMMLNSIRNGILDNSSVQMPDLLIFIFNMVREYILVDRNKKIIKEKVKPHKITIEEALTIQPIPQRNQDLVVDQTTAWFHLVGEMSLKLLSDVLRSKKSKLSSNNMAPMVDPYVSLLLEVMDSKFTPAVIYAVKAFVVIIEMKAIPSLAPLLDTIATKVFGLLLKSQDSKLTRHCFSFATVLAEKVTKYAISEPQLIALVSIVREDINDEEKRQPAFEMLQALLTRRLLCPDMYDLMKDISKMLVQDSDQVVRDYCITSFVSFLIYYPLGNKRLDQHIHFLMQNLNYSVEEGRMAVLQTFAKILEQFPVEVINQYSHLIFVPLVSRLASDVSSTVRQKTDEVIKVLVGRVGETEAADLFMNPTELQQVKNTDSYDYEQASTSLVVDIGSGDDKGWNIVGSDGNYYADEEEEETEKKDDKKEDKKDEDEAMVDEEIEDEEDSKKVEQKKDDKKDNKEDKARETQIAGSHLIGIFAEIKSNFFENKELVPTIQKILDVAQVSVGVTIVGGRREQLARQTWGNIYALLKSLERAFAANPNLLLNAHFNPTWYSIYSIMMHPHGWVRHTCARLLGLYFSTRNLDKAITKMQENKKPDPKESKDLLTATPALRIFLNSIILLRSSGLTAKMGEQLVKNIIFLVPIFIQCGNLRVPDDYLHDDDEVDESERENNKEKEKGRERQVLQWMFDRLLAMSWKKGNVKMSCVFHLIAALTVKLRSKNLKPYLVHIAKIIYRYEQNRTLLPLKRAVKKAIASAVGAEAYASAELAVQKEYKNIKQAAKKTREDDDDEEDLPEDENMEDNNEQNTNNNENDDGSPDIEPQQLPAQDDEDKEENNTNGNKDSDNEEEEKQTPTKNKQNKQKIGKKSPMTKKRPLGGAGSSKSKVRKLKK